MQWESLLAEFRELGGVAENVRLGSGARGRGLFVVEPQQPARIFLPPNLRIPTDAVELRGEELLVLPGGAGEREARFFDRYQREFVWSQLARDEAYRKQRLWHELPGEIVQAIGALGVMEYQWRFEPPSAETALADFTASYAFASQGRTVFIPVVDLVNHSALARGYVFNGERAGIEGTFENEVLVRYNDFDPIACAMTYSFADRSVFANSISITVGIPGGKALWIQRRIGSARSSGALRMPVLEERDERLDLAYLPLGNRSAPDLPRAIFRELMKPYLKVDAADATFESIAHFNRSRFLDFLRLLRRFDGPLVSVLEEASIDQLEALSASVGARAL